MTNSSFYDAIVVWGSVPPATHLHQLPFSSLTRPGPRDKGTHAAKKFVTSTDSQISSTSRRLLYLGAQQWVENELIYAKSRPSMSIGVMTWSSPELSSGQCMTELGEVAATTEIRDRDWTKRRSRSQARLSKASYGRRRRRPSKCGDPQAGDLRDVVVRDVVVTNPEISVLLSDMIRPFLLLLDRGECHFHQGNVGGTRRGGKSSVCKMEMRGHQERSKHPILA
ncbi:hypothetical protein QBC43DRAFT_335887 [Cladorrhinum sp. PSN259]|nr:hypothetical protein QBC43DRAFT_335887 [Cladorrhinum sp. PSN259]